MTGPFVDLVAWVNQTCTPVVYNFIQVGEQWLFFLCVDAHAVHASPTAWTYLPEPAARRTRPPTSLPRQEVHGAQGPGEEAAQENEGGNEEEEGRPGGRGRGEQHLLRAGPLLAAND